MSRSGYGDNGQSDDEVEYYRDWVRQSLASNRGQAFLRELAAEMDAMPDKALIEEELIDEEGNCCTLGVAWKARGLPPSRWDPTECDGIAQDLGIDECIVREIAYMNDGFSETPEQRWKRMRAWVEQRINQRPENAIAEGR